MTKGICDTQDHPLNKYLQRFEGEFPKGKAFAKSAAVINERDASMLYLECSVKQAEAAKDQNRK